MKQKQIKNRTEELMVQFDETTLKFTVSKLETEFKSVAEFSVLNLLSELNEKATISELEDNFEIEFTVNPNYLPYETIQGESYLEKLRLAINLCDLENELEHSLVPFIHPDNIVFDLNLNPHVYYRGMVNNLLPKDYNHDTMLIELKSFVISLLEDQFSYEELVRSNIKIKEYKGNLMLVFKAESIADLKSLLIELFLSEKQELKDTMSLVSIKKQKSSQIYKITSAGLLIILSITLAFTFLVTLPDKNAQINATTYYLASDYNQVISILKGYSTKKLSSSSKYILAHSAIANSTLTTSQKDNLMKKLSVNSYDLYLDYWINYGRGEFVNAHEDARAMQDIELKYFAVISYLDYLSSETKLSSTDKQVLIQEYEGYRSTYEKELETLQETPVEVKPNE